MVNFIFVVLGIYVSISSVPGTWADGAEWVIVGAFWFLYGCTQMITDAIKDKK